MSDFKHYSFTSLSPIAMLPENLNIDKLLSDHHPEDSPFFIRNNRGYVVSYPGKAHANRFDEEKIIYILGLIPYVSSRSSDNVSEGGYVRLSSQILQDHVPDYKAYVGYLCYTHVLERTSYIKGECCFGYRYTSTYAHQPFQKYVFSYAKQAITSDFSCPAFTPEPSLPIYLGYWYSTNLLQINEPQAMQYAYNVARYKYETGKMDINASKTRNPNQPVFKDPFAQYRSATDPIAKLAMHYYNPVISDSNHRLHSPLTNLPKDERNWVTYDDQPLVNVDIHNSQPFLLCLLLRPEFWQEDSPLPVNLYNLPQNIKDLFITLPEGANPNNITVRDQVLDFLDNKADFQKFDNYKEMVRRGRIYEAIAEEINKLLLDSNDSSLATPHTYTRSDAKSLTFYMMFSSNYGHHSGSATPDDVDEMWEIFKTQMFPSIAEMIMICKHRFPRGGQKQHNRLALLLQAIEAQIILHRVCKRIWYEGNQKIPVFTVHDSIITTAQNREFVRDIMQQELLTTIGLSPTIEIEHLGLNNLKYPRLVNWPQLQTNNSHFGLSLPYPQFAELVTTEQKNFSLTSSCPTLKLPY